MNKCVLLAVALSLFPAHGLSWFLPQFTPMSSRSATVFGSEKLGGTAEEM
jgi:hypothetical protein